VEPAPGAGVRLVGRDHCGRAGAGIIPPVGAAATTITIQLMPGTTVTNSARLAVNAQRLLERFLQYVRIDTTARDDADDYPSSPGQLELGRLVVEQLQAMGLTNARQDEHGIVTATLAGNVPHAVPVVAFNAHFDTSPETTGANVQPQVLAPYGGGDISLLAAGKTITVAATPELTDLAGKTLVTSDGTTLLGADDKAGVSIMMELANMLVDQPHIEHGPVRLLFTCDEEIGRGVKYVDVDAVGATVCYTFDGGGTNQVDVETFSADQAIIRCRGVNTHPSVGKDKMVNAVRAAGEFLARMPKDMSPERTDGRQGFLHPYVIEGGVAEVMIKTLLRDFDTARLTDQANILKRIAVDVERAVAGCQVEVQITRQYRNMADGLVREPRAVAYALEAHQRLGREPKQTIVRGGTDGSQLTERGLPTPNLSSGQHNIHSPLEFACVDEMVAACEVGIEILRVWSDYSRPR